MRSRIERPTADEMRMQLRSAGTRFRQDTRQPDRSWLASSSALPGGAPAPGGEGRNARATFLTICFRYKNRALHFAAQGFRTITSPPRGWLRIFTDWSARALKKSYVFNVTT